MLAVRYIIYFPILLYATLSGLILYKKADKATKYFILFITLTTIVEYTGTYCAHIYHYSAPIFNLSAPIRFILLASFYYELGYIGRIVKKPYMMYIITAAAIINWITFQNPFDTTCTNFLTFESIIITALSLHYFYSIVLDEKISKYDNIFFLLVSTMLLFWSFTLFKWLLFLDIYTANIEKAINLTSIMTYTINDITYLSCAIVFTFYHKIAHDE